MVKLVSMHWLRHALLATSVVVGAVAFGCSTENYTFKADEPVDVDAGDEPLPPPPPSTPTACTTDDDCSALAATQLCDVTAGYCVECDPGREAELHRCGEGTFCSAGNTCALGCAGDADCRGITCDVERHLCVNCTIDTDCAAGTACIDATCTPSCAGNESCPYGWLCCDGACQNPDTTHDHCGSCGNVCDPVGACWNGICGEGPCAPGTAECDGNAENGCETTTTDDPQNCGKCQLTCASDHCAGGRCTTVGCVAGTADCNGAENDQCETDLTSVDDCRMCGQKCDATHGTPSCNPSEGCGIACEDGYDDCDGKVTNGCEIDLLEDEKHCGDCDTECSNEHGTTECKDGECDPRCANGFEDCDGDATNGCETNTDTSRDSCGACGKKCNPDNADGTCTDGVCKVKCEDGFEDCDGNSKNGCEADLTAPETCGSCDTFCSDNGGKAKCADPAQGLCEIKCDANHADCANGVVDGCETDITVSVGNCGGCGVPCTSSVGTPACIEGKCGVSDCTQPNEECVPDDDKKCETNVTADPLNCGGCGNMCYYKNGKGVCTAKTCELDSCTAGFDDCNKVPTDGCETALGTKANCRTCGEACTNDHGTNGCTESGCEPSCSSGWGDCDGNKNNGCETQLNSLTDCGECGQSCTKAHGNATCESGSCQIDGCTSGWDDCSPNENSAKDGCETQLNTLSNCRACGDSCNLANGSASCGTGSCVLTGCNSGYSDCTTQAGCETELGTNTDCAACGNACTAASGHGSNACDKPNKVCKPVCPGNGAYGDCDGNPSNGCEADLHTLTNCGGCGTPCSRPNATASCSTGSCVVQGCNSGFLDCGGTTDGCETTRGTTQNCRTCGESCSNAHGTSACNTTTGCTYTCNPVADWDNCDLDPKNGCETSLKTTSNCATCGSVCNFPTSGESCSTGTCQATTCDLGTDDCDSNNSCETTLDTVNDCNSCGHTCTAQNGTTSCTGATGSKVCNPSCSFGFKSCDSNPDNGCERSITTLTDCGNCNSGCSFAHAAASCAVVPSTSITCTMGTCTSGFANCDSSTATGCETALGNTTNCGGCGDACTNSHGTTSCVSAKCAPDCQTTGYGNCDSNLNNGCETQLNSATNCGACGTPCSRAHAASSCTTGSCELTSCSSGWKDCSANEGTSKDGCETQLGTVSNCSDCGHDCTNAHGSVSCVSAACAPSCSWGYASCNDDLDDGCETSTTANTACGGCPGGANDCTNKYAHAAGTCNVVANVSATCAMGACSTGYANCDSSSTNGCEVQLGTDTNCSTCGDACLAPHGTNKCDTANRLCKPDCTGSGYGDCDGNPSNGCEANLTTPAACGVCGNNCGSDDCVSISGTYKCQARVKYSADADGNVSGTTLDVSHALAAGSNRIVLAAIVTESTQTAGIAGARPTAVTYDGLAMTHTTSLEQTSDSGSAGFDNPYLYYYYLTDTGTPKLPTSTGSKQLHVTGTSGKVVMIAANVISFTGAAQTSPIILGTGKNFTAAGSTCTMTGNITTTLLGSALYVLTSGHYSGTATAQGGITASIGLGEIGNSVRVHGGYKDSTAAALAIGSSTIGYNYAWCSPAVVLPIAISPYRQP